MLDAHDPIIHPMCLILIHLLLLFVQFPDHGYLPDLTGVWCITFHHEVFKVSIVTEDAIQHEPDDPTDFLRRTLLALGEVQILLPCNAVVHPRQFQTIVNMERG